MIIALACTGTVFAVSDGRSADSGAKEYSAAAGDAVKLMEYLDILEIDNDGEAEVSRADFATYMARVVKVNEYAKTDNNTAYYYDVPPEHWAAACVNNLTETGALSVGDDKLFRPNDTITVTEATKIVLSVMGYGAYANVTGGYPTGYTATAKKLRLYDGVGSMENLTKLDAAVLLCNALNTAIADGVPYEGGTKYNTNSEKTLLGIYHDMYVTEGRLETVNEVSLYPGRKLENAIEVDGILYNCSVSTDLIGHDVKVYYRQERECDPEAVLIISKTDKDDILKIPADDFISFSDSYTLSYYGKNGQKKAVNIPRNASVIYNGVCAQEDIVNLVNIDDGEICTVRGKSSGTYDVLIVRESETIVAGFVDETGKKVYDSADSTKMIDLSGDTEKARICDENGNEIPFSSIKKNSVLSVYRFPGERIEVWSCERTIYGKYTGTTLSGGKTYIIVDGEKYQANKKYYDTIKEKLVLSQDMSFGLDIYGRIACIADAADNGDYTFGYYIKHAKADKGIDDGINVKLYSQTEGLKAYKMADRVRIDGTQYKGADKIETAFENSISLTKAEYEKFKNRPKKAESRIIRYKLNNDGEICDIDTPYRGERESEDSLTISSAETNVNYIWMGIIGYTTTFDKNTVLFQVPEDAELKNADAKMFYIGNGVKSLGSGVSIIGYKISPDNGANDLIVHITDVDSELRIANHVMFDGIETTLDSDGMDKECLVGYSAGVEVKYTVSNDVTDDKGQKIKMNDADIDTGDLLILAFDAAGEIDRYCRIYDCSENKTYSPSGLKIFTKDYEDTGDYRDVFYAGERMTFGYVNSVHPDGVIDLGYVNGGTVKEAYPTGNIPVTVCDMSLRKNNIYKGTIKDVASYEDAGTNCSHIIVHSQYAVWKSYYVYK